MDIQPLLVITFYLVLFSIVALFKGNTLFIVVPFYLLVLKLLKWNWKNTSELSILKINSTWKKAAQGLAILILLLYGNILFTLTGMGKKKLLPHVSNVFFPILISVLFLMGDLESNPNQRKGIIFFIYFDLVRWIIYNIYTFRNKSSDLNLYKIKFKIQIVDNKI